MYAFKVTVLKAKRDLLSVGQSDKKRKTQKNFPKTLKLLMLPLEENSVSLCFLFIQNEDYQPLNGRMKTAVQN